MPNYIPNYSFVNRFFFSFKFTALATIIASFINIYFWLSGNINNIFTGYTINPDATMKIITSISFILLASIYFTNNKTLIKSLIAFGLIIQCIQFLLTFFNIYTSDYWALSSPITLVLFCLAFMSFYFIKVKINKTSFLIVNGFLYVLSNFAVFLYLLNVDRVNAIIGFETLSWNTSILFFMNSISLFELKLVKRIDTLKFRNIGINESHPYKYYPFFFLMPILFITGISVLYQINLLTVIESAFIIILFLNTSSFINMFLYSYNFIKYYIEINEKSNQLQIKNHELSKLNEKLTSLNKTISKKKAYLEDFATITSHSLREPIVALVELKKVTDCIPLKEEFPKEELNNMYMASIQRLNQGINSLINYHKFIKTEDLIHKAETTVSKSIKDTYKSLENLKPDDTTLNIDITSDQLFPKIYINNIFENLFTNSFKFKNKTEALNIQITCYKTKNAYNIFYKDNGIGINLKEHKNDVFKKGKRFHYQSNSSNGYGLFFVKLYVNKLNGKIAVFSEVDKGTAFRIIIKK